MIFQDYEKIFIPLLNGSKSNNMKIRSNLAVSENGFVFDPSTGESFSVNEVGVEILNQLKITSDTEEIVKHLEGIYEIDALTLEKSIADFMTMMEEFNLINHG